MKGLCLIVAALFILSLNACMTLSNTREGRVLEKKEVLLGATAGLATSTEELRTNTDVSVYFKGGLGRKFQFFAFVSWYSSARAELSYQFIGDANSLFAMAVSVAPQIQLYNNQYINSLVGYELPLAFSFNPTPWAAWYGSACFNNFRSSTAFQYQNVRFYYLTSGIRLGEKVGITLETNIIPRKFNPDALKGFPYASQQQFHVGMFVKF